MDDKNKNSIKDYISYSIFLGFYLGCIDMTISFIRCPRGLSNIFSILPPLATASVFISFLIFPVYFLINRFFQSWFDFKRLKSEIAFLIMMTIVFIFSRAFYLTRLSTLTIVHIIQMIILILISFGFAVTITKQKQVSNSSFNSWMVLKNSLLVFVLGSMIGLWLLQYPFSEMAFHIRAFASLLLIALLCISIVITSKVKKSAFSSWISIGCITLCVLTGMPSQISMHINSPCSKETSQEMNLPIKNILLITIDALRSDFISCYSDYGVITPSIDKIAQDGFLFENAYSAAPWTKPSFISIMTGHSPVSFQANSFESCLPETLTTIAETMDDLGYCTGAVGNNHNLLKIFDFDQGFHYYEFYPKFREDVGLSLGSILFYHVLLGQYKELDATTYDLASLAIQWLKKTREKPFFLWLHFLDPHMPYSPPAEYLPKIDPPPRIGNSFYSATDIRAGIIAPDLTEREWIRQLYRSEIKYVDDNVERIIKTLKQLHCYEETLIIVTSDHGEEFWEHGNFEHGQSLYNELLHVPLIIKLPKIFSHEKPQRFSHNVSLQSLFPTLLDLCEYPDSISLPYPSLRYVWDQEKPFQSPPIFSSGIYYYDDRQSVIQGDEKYIRNLTIPGRDEFFNLKADPEEKSSRMNIQPNKLKSMQSVMDTLCNRAISVGIDYRLQNKKAKKLPEADLKQIRSLGYLK